MWLSTDALRVGSGRPKATILNRMAQTWHDVAAHQHGVVRRGAALPRQRADAELRRGALRRQGRHALVVAGSPASVERDLWIAACEVGEPLTFTGTTALSLYGVPVPKVQTVPIVLVPRSRVAARTRVARVHRVVARELARSRTAHGHQVTSVPVSVRRAGVELTVGQLAEVVEHVLRLRLSTTEQLRRTLGRGLVGAAALRAALDLVCPDSHGVWERRLAALIRAAGLPRPRRQAPVPGETTYWLDFLFPQWSLAVEVDGFLVHATPETFVYGLRRTRRLQVRHGIDVLAYAPVEIRDRGEDVVAEIAAELRRRGATIPW